MTAEQAAIARAGLGVSDHAMTGAWRVIIARKPEHARTWYYHAGDHSRQILALQNAAARWIDTP
jgi:hypothetical protein